MTSEQINKVREAVWSTPEGYVILTFPDGISVQTVDDLQEWWELISRSMRRIAETNDKRAAEAAPETQDE